MRPFLVGLPHTCFRFPFLDRQFDDPTLHGGFSLAKDSVNGYDAGCVTNLYYNPRVYHSLPAYISLANNALIQNYTADPSIRIRTENHVLPLRAWRAAKTQRQLQTATDLTVAVFVIMAFSFVPASSLVFLVGERETGFKHLQFASGMTPAPFWFANLAFDILICSISVFLSLSIFQGFELAAYTGRNFAAIATLFVSYIFGITPLMYPFSLLFKVPSTVCFTPSAPFHPRCVVRRCASARCVCLKDATPSATSGGSGRKVLKLACAFCHLAGICGDVHFHGFHRGVNDHGNRDP